MANRNRLLQILEQLSVKVWDKVGGDGGGEAVLGEEGVDEGVHIPHGHLFISAHILHAIEKYVTL